MRLGGPRAAADPGERAAWLRLGRVRLGGVRPGVAVSLPSSSSSSTSNTPSTCVEPGKVSICVAPGHSSTCVNPSHGDDSAKGEAAAADCALTDERAAGLRRLWLTIGESSSRATGDGMLCCDAPLLAEPMLKGTYAHVAVPPAE